MWKVIVAFSDMTDGNYQYKPGDTFPRPGLEVEWGRIAELVSDSNRRRMPLIKEVQEAPPRRRRREKDDADGGLPGATELVRPGDAET